MKIKHPFSIRARKSTAWGLQFSCVYNPRYKLFCLAIFFIHWAVELQVGIDEYYI